VKRRVILVNPSLDTAGFSFITPRWLFVIAQATPLDLVGEPVLVDEALERFDDRRVSPGDIVGIGMSSGNCIPGYRVLRQAKLRGATVIVGGIHATLFPRETLEMGADAVVTGNGDLAWGRAIRDALDGRLEQRYEGGRLPGESLLKARWDLIDPTKYMMASVQTVAGCPENCSFCSVWVTDGRSPRQRHAAKVIEEACQLYELGFRYIVFADDNFTPATSVRIAREPGRARRLELERAREERLRFFDEYDGSVPGNLYAFTQMTSEIVGDDEYLEAVQRKARVRVALVGVESFTEEGLASTNKKWNPAGASMVRTIRTLQERGILVLASIICGLESDTLATLRAMRELAKESGSILAQFTLYSPYPGTKDYHEMLSDLRNRHRADFVPKRRIQLLRDRYWLDMDDPVRAIRHPNLTSDELLSENLRCWDDFYSIAEIRRRIRTGVARSWPLAGKVTYLFLSLVFKRVYGGRGLAADSVKRKRLGVGTRALIRTAVAVYSRFFRKRGIGFRVPLARRTHAGA